MVITSQIVTIVTGATKILIIKSKILIFQIITFKDKITFVMVR
jgi:hypothetical protein